MPETHKVILLHCLHCIYCEADRFMAFRRVKGKNIAFANKADYTKDYEELLVN